MALRILGSGDERKDTVDWMRTYCTIDHELQLRLINSLFEHYQSRIDRKRAEMPAKQDDESISEELQRAALETRIAEEIQTLMIEKMDPINKAIASETEKFEKIRHLIPITWTRWHSLKSLPDQLNYMRSVFAIRFVSLSILKKGISLDHLAKTKSILTLKQTTGPHAISQKLITITIPYFPKKNYPSW